MPLERYDKYFGGAKGSASKAAKALQKEYGAERGRGYFYAIVRKRQRAAARARSKRKGAAKGKAY